MAMKTYWVTRVREERTMFQVRASSTAEAIEEVKLGHFAKKGEPVVYSTPHLTEFTCEESFIGQMQQDAKAASAELAKASTLRQMTDVGYVQDVSHAGLGTAWIKEDA